MRHGWLWTRQRAGSMSPTTSSCVSAAFALEPGIRGLTQLGSHAASGGQLCLLRRAEPRSPSGGGCDLWRRPRRRLRSRCRGKLLPDPQVLRGTGTSAPGHAHWVQWSPERIASMSSTLATMRCASTPGTGPAARSVRRQTAFRTPGGHGPRHLAFHPGGKTAYLLTEHGNTLVALARQADGTLREIHDRLVAPRGLHRQGAGRAHPDQPGRHAGLRLEPRASTPSASSVSPATAASAPMQQVADRRRVAAVLPAARAAICSPATSGATTSWCSTSRPTARSRPTASSLALKAPVMLLPVAA